MNVVLTLLPVVVVLALLVVWKWSADTSGLVGWLLTLAIACFLFETSIKVGLTASLAGIIASFPVSLMVLTSIFQITFLESTGALQRIVVFVKTIAKNDRAVQIMFINMGIGTLLVAVGATPVSILPPIMLALGYSTFVAIALPALGFDSLCTYALLGAPLVAFSDLTQTSLTDSALVFSTYMPVISTLIGVAMLWMAGGFKQVKEGLIPCLIAGLTMGLTAMGVAHIPNIGRGVVLTGVIAGFATVMVMVIYLKIQGKPVFDRSDLQATDISIEESMSLLKALSPWIILITACLFINFYKPLGDFLAKDLAMKVDLIPGGKPIATRMLWNAYTWVIVSTLLAIPFFKPSSGQWKEIMTKWLKRAPRPVFATAIFFSIAKVMELSGVPVSSAAAWVPTPDHNMISILATTSADFFGRMYPAITGFLGLLGGFITGSEASAIAMFTKYNMQTSGIIKAAPLITTAGIAIAGGLASVISPAKLQNAAATIDAIGEESRVIPKAFIISVLLTLVSAAMTFMWAYQ
ncbi:MAG: L-lactate permease [Acidobacteriota bacterium]